MERSIRLFGDGKLYEIVDGEAVGVVDPEGSTDKLIEALQMMPGDRFTVAEAGEEAPFVQSTRAIPRQINAEGLRLVKTYEGLYLNSYQDAVGVWTIGYGCTEGIGPGMSITKQEAEDMLRGELSKFEAAVAKFVNVEINDNQYSALVAFSYNVGAYALKKSTLLRKLNGGDYAGASNEFPRWDKAGGRSLLGLSRRRRSERALFLSEPWDGFLNWEPGDDAPPSSGSSGGGGSSDNARLLRLQSPYMRGEDVRTLQLALVKAGIDIDVDGVFGRGSDKAVKAFQNQKGLGADGIVGPNTRKNLGI
ncbi:MAG: glycoside hydrolase family protein [Cyanobacteria bacterium P01_D01_bin.73]